MKEPWLYTHVVIFSKALHKQKVPFLSSPLSLSLSLSRARTRTHTQTVNILLLTYR